MFRRPASTFRRRFPSALDVSTERSTTPIAIYQLDGDLFVWFSINENRRSTDWHEIDWLTTIERRSIGPLRCNLPISMFNWCCVDDRWRRKDIRSRIFEPVVCILCDGAYNSKGYYTQAANIDCCSGRFCHDRVLIPLRAMRWFLLFTLAIAGVTSQSGRICEPIEIEYCRGIGYNVTGKYETYITSYSFYTHICTPCVKYRYLRYKWSLVINLSWKEQRASCMRIRADATLES